jgi:hypothetical protein
MGVQFGKVVRLKVSTAFIEYTLTDNSIEFDILRRRESKPNEAKIVIYGLSETTRNAFKDEQDFTTIEFSAGYQDSEPSVLFKGSVSNVWSEHENGTTWKTTVAAAEGHREFEKSYFSKTYDDGIVLDTILTEIANALGVAIESNVPELIFVKTVAPVVLEGKAKDCLDRLAEDYDFSWSINFDALEVTAKGEPPTKEQTATVLGPNSGLIGIPSLSWAKKKKNKKSKPKFESTVTLRANLNGDVRPNRIIEVRAENTTVSYGSAAVETVPSTDANGFYLVDTARYTGDNEPGGPFEMKVVADGR